MGRLATIRLVAAMLAGLAAMAISPALAQDSYAGMIEASNAEIEARLQLSGTDKAKADAILQEYAQERIAAFNDLGIEWGERPHFSTLLELKKKMDAIETTEQTELSKVLSEEQMYTIHSVEQEWRGKFTKALLGT